MATKWTKYKLSEITSKLGDGLHGTPKYDDSGEYYFVNGNNLDNGKIVIKSDTKKVNYTEFEKYKKELNDRTILLSINGTLGNIAYYNNEKIILGKSACYFNLNNDFSKDFVRYVMSTNNFKIFLENFATGATIKNVSLEAMRNFEFEAPKKEIQDKIAKILSNYDDLIENNNKRIKILEEMAQKIYKEWFVDFKFPNHETATFKQTDLGKIPTDWEINKLSDFGETITGKTPSKNDDSNYGKEVDFIKTPDMHNGIFCLDTVEHLSLKGANTQKNKFIPIGSICVSCIGTVGVVAITTKNSQTNQQINSIIPKNSFYREYLYFVCNNLKPTLENLGANGATMTNVNKNKFDNIQVSKPSDKLLQAFSQLIKPIFEQIKNLSLKNQTLKQTRDLLLPRLISGEIDVENMEIK